MTLEENLLQKLKEKDSAIREFEALGDREGLNEKAEELLLNPEFFQRIDDELEKKIVGEKETRKAIFLFACISLVENKGKGASNNLLINAQSSSGKDYISKQITALFPYDSVESLNRASANAFTYWKANDQNFTWNGKICRLTDISEQLLKSDAFKTFLSDEEKSVIVNKNKAGQIGAFEYAVQGKPVVIGTTATASPSDEILNRFNIITLDESQEQTEAITLRRLKEAEGEFDEQQEYAPEVLQAISKLKPVKVRIPFALLLVNFLPNDLRSRRDVPRILNLIKASATIHQYQRERDSQNYVLATEQDYEISRKALSKIQTGQFVSLTRALTRTFEALRDFEKENSIRPTVKQLHAFKPFCSERQYYEHLDKLSALNLVKPQYYKPEGATKEITCFSTTDINLKSVFLPPFKELESSKYSIPSLPSKPSIPSKQGTLEGGFEHFEGFEVKKSIGDAQNG